MAQLTEKEIRQIAREESEKVFAKATKKLSSDIRELRKSTAENKSILARIDRLLVGEEGRAEDTLTKRADFAYHYAKKNTDQKIVERAIPALKWFEDMNTTERGEDECKLDSLGRVIISYGRIKWMLGLLGLTTLINAIPIIQRIVKWITSYAVN